MHNFNQGDKVKGSYYGTEFKGIILKRLIGSQSITNYYIQLDQGKKFNGYYMERIMLKIDYRCKYNGNFLKLGA